MIDHMVIKAGKVVIDETYAIGIDDALIGDTMVFEEQNWKIWNNMDEEEGKQIEKDVRTILNGQRCVYLKCVSRRRYNNAEDYMTIVWEVVENKYNY